MAHNPQISELQAAVGEHYVGKSNASGIQEYKQLNADYFLHGADIKVKLSSFFNDEEGTNMPAPHNAPINPPSNPILGATLMEAFDDNFVNWEWDGTNWIKLWTEFRYEFIYLNYSAVGTSVSNGTAVIPPQLANWKVIRICAYNNSVTNIAATAPILTINLAPAGPNHGVPANASSCVTPVGLTVGPLNFLRIDPARMPAAPVDFAMVLTLQRP